MARGLGYVTRRFKRLGWSYFRENVRAHRL
jgi:hypothetical protein